MKLVAGLGNPGAQYRNTRHNIGFMAVDRLAEDLGTSFGRERFQSLVAEGRCGGDKVVLLKPLTFMNRSGFAVSRAVQYGKIELDDVLVVLDDVNLPLGRLRFRGKGSAGGHNGLKSIIEQLGTQEVPRLRIGVGDVDRKGGLTGHVLGAFREEERPDVDRAVDRAAEGVRAFLTQGLEHAMNVFNREAPA